MQSQDGTNDGLDVSNLPRAQNYIYGQFEDTDTYIDSYEPSTGKVWALIPNSNGKCYNYFHTKETFLILCKCKFMVR